MTYIIPQIGLNVWSLFQSYWSGVTPWHFVILIKMILLCKTVKILGCSQRAFLIHYGSLLLKSAN